MKSLSLILGLAICQPFFNSNAFLPRVSVRRIQYGYQVLKIECIKTKMGKNYKVKVMNIEKPQNIKAIVGLGNPGSKFTYTRHNIGFRILDYLGDKYNCDWSKKSDKSHNNLEFCDIDVNNTRLILVKPLTFMNDSGKAINFLINKNIKPEEILVVHDELEKPFGKTAFKFGGSPRGHNGLKSIIAHIGKDFWRLRFGIDRPENKHEVPDYVLAKFSENSNLVENQIEEAAKNIEDLF